MSDVTSLIYAVFLVVMGLGAIAILKLPSREEAPIPVSSETPANDDGGYDG